jgi:hypothetical protein
MKAPKKLLLMLVLCAVMVAGAPVGYASSTGRSTPVPQQVVQPHGPDSGYWGAGAGWWILTDIIKEFIQRFNDRRG